MTLSLGTAALRWLLSMFRTCVLSRWSACASSFLHVNDLYVIYFTKLHQWQLQSVQFCFHYQQSVAEKNTSQLRGFCSKRFLIGSVDIQCSLFHLLHVPVLGRSWYLEWETWTINSTGHRIAPVWFFLPSAQQAMTTTVLEGWLVLVIGKGVSLSFCSRLKCPVVQGWI